MMTAEAEALTMEQASVFAEQRPDIAAGLVRVVSSGVLVHLASSRRQVESSRELQQQNSQSLIAEGEK